MLNCWMALTESYTVELAARLKQYRVYWMEECLMPDDYVGMGHLNAKVGSTRMATGEHESTHYGFELLAHHKAADIWQPDMNWCGGWCRLGAVHVTPTSSCTGSWDWLISACESATFRGRKHESLSESRMREIVRRVTRW